MFLGFGVDVSEDVDVGEVDPEPAEQRGHPEGHAPARKEQTAQRVKISGLVPGELRNSDCFSSAHVTHARRSWSMRLILPPMKTRILQSPHLLLLVSRNGMSRVRPASTNTHFIDEDFTFPLALFFFFSCVTAYYKLGSQEGLRAVSAVTEQTQEHHGIIK